MKTILFVDDEIQILKAIGRIFIDSGYRTYFAESADEGLKILKDNDVDLIVSDMRMPEMDGIEFLKIVRQKHPEVVRIILSGYSDENEILHTLQTNLAKAYLFKPWDNDELIRIVQENLADKNMPIPNEIISAINNLEGLPTINYRYEKILAAVRDERDLTTIAAEIEKDQTITAKLLQIVNSAYYGVKTASVKKALAFTGLDNLKNIVTSMELMDCIPVKGAASQVAEKIWNHAYYSNKIQHILLTSFLNRENSHDNATAGLLHKIGVVFMIQHFGQEYVSLLEQTLGGAACYLGPAEKEKYGFSHPALSAYLLRWWNAPAPIVESAAYYDAPFECPEASRELTCVIHIAQHYACQHLKMGPFCSFQPESFHMLGIDRESFEAEFGQLK